MNHTIIHDRAGLNQFYAKVYAFVGLGIGLSALVSGLMLTVFQSQLVYFFDAGTSLVDHCNLSRASSGLCCQQYGFKE